MLETRVQVQMPKRAQGAGWLGESQSQGARGPVLHSGDVFAVHSILYHSITSQNSKLATVLQTSQSRYVLSFAPVTGSVLAFLFTTSNALLPMLKGWSAENNTTQDEPGREASLRVNCLVQEGCAGHKLYCSLRQSLTLSLLSKPWFFTNLCKQC